MKPSKIFVLDTNVILYDFRCIYNFQENDIVIPITVLEELDKFKKGNEQVNFNAREFVRVIDRLSGDKIFREGIPLGKDLGKLSVVLYKPLPQGVQDALGEMIPDHKILAAAYYIKHQYPDSITALVTKDVNLRLKAKAFSIDAQDYLSGRVKNVEHISKNITLINYLTDEQIGNLYETSPQSQKHHLLKEQPFANQCFQIEGARSSALARYNAVTRSLVPVKKQRIYGIEPRNIEQSFALNVLLDPYIKLIALTGGAGTGKTLLALAAALHQKNDYDDILLSRPVIPLQNQDLGFLPGNIKEKLSPYMLPLYDNLTVIKNSVKPNSKELQRIAEMEKEERLSITPLAYIRGRSLSNTVFIIDEAQNLTPHEVKTIITRAGENTKMIFTGDVYQIDSPYLDIHSNGLTHLCYKLRGEALFAHVNLVKGERSALADVASKKL